WSNGAQIIPPHDTGMSGTIDDVGEVVLADVRELRATGQLQAPDTVILENYYREVLELRVLKSTGARAVYSAMHGVGGRFVMEALRRAGHTDVLPVPEQFDPDAGFPTVAFPNPEEPGALDLALALAESEKADLVVANDPDADRLAVAVRDQEGHYIPLSGNEVGLLLAECLMSHGGQRNRPMLATTIVSSTMLRKIAAAHHAAYAETLTGFKWIANRAIAHGESGGDFVLGFEEALGYSVGPVVRDKDGVSALLLLLDLASAEKMRGRTLLDSLEDLYRRYGLHLSEQVALKFPGADGAETIAGLMSRLRSSPPSGFLGHAVTVVTDLSNNSRTAQGIREEAGFPLSNVLGFELDNGYRILARPSGTEPKIKFYFEVQAAIGEDQELPEVQVELAKALESLKKSFLGMLDL
ncbi:MAG: phospho-sugar mutase, partial [Myxococcota bacterium]|nr:phospho-sugar mutase [Myxococcota bacterium]